MQNEPSGEYIQSLARGLEVIRAFDADHASMTLSDVAKATGLTRATARRFLLTLAELGYVRNDGRLFALTPRVLELGFSYLAGLGLPEIAQPHLEALSHRLGESTSASVLDDLDIVYVARVPTRRIMSVRISIGTRFPAYATSMGRVLLSGLPESSLDELLSRVEPQSLTPSTIRTIDELRAEVRTVRASGYSLVDQELEAGLRSLAVPVRVAGEVTAAINVSTSAASSTPAAMRSGMLPAMLEASSAIERDLALQGR